MRYAIATLFTASSNGLNSLEELYNPSNGDICYCLENNRFYQWVAASTATPSGSSVIRKRFVPVATPGRWLVRGAPGPGQIPPGFANALTSGIGMPVLAQLQGVTVGGSPTELIDISPTAEGGNYWSTTDALVLTRLANQNPNLAIRGSINGVNNCEVALVDTSGGNIGAGLTVYAWVFRLSIPS